MTRSMPTLEYDISAEEIGDLMRRAGRGWWSEWVRRLIATIMLWLAVSAWHDQHYWMCGFIVFAAIFMATPRVVVLWWLLRPSIKKHSPVHVRIEMGGIGLQYPNAPEQCSQVIAWSRLSSVKEVEDGFELTFDSDSNPLLTVPSCAFTDEEQRAAFRSLVEQHLPDPVSVNVA